jgi:hypothetical protein
LRREVNAVKPISATSASQDPALFLLVPDGLGVADRSPGIPVDRGDRLDHGGVHPGGDREVRAAAAGGGDHVVAVERRVAAQQYQPAAVGPAGTARARSGQRLGHQLPCAAGGLDRPLAQPGAGDHRRRDRRADCGQQRVEPLDLGVAVTGTLLGVAVGLPHRVVQVQEADLVGTGQQRSAVGQRGQECCGHRVELADVAEGEAAQERAQRAGRPDAGEQPVHAAVAQQVHVIDRVRAGDHPGHQRRHLQLRVHPAGGLQRELVGDQLTQAAVGREREHRGQPGDRHEIRIIERRRQRRRTVRQSHPADALLRGR